MKPELTVDYLHSIQPDPLPRLVEMSEKAWTEAWLVHVRAAIDSDLVGIELYDAFPDSWAIPHDVWEARLVANWARLVEYDRLTDARKRNAPERKAQETRA